MLRGLLFCLLLLAAPLASAEQLRIALLNTELDRKGPGLLLRDIAKGEDPQIDAVRALLTTARADIIVLLRFDWDADGAAISAFANRLAEAGLEYPHRIAPRPNTGMDTALDLDGDGRARGPRDAQGYGLFPGQNGVAVLSRFPIDRSGLRDFSALLWRDLPGAQMPTSADGSPFPSEAAQLAQRLSSVGNWDVPVVLPGGHRLHLLVFHASPPVFDGPEDANGLRNADELRLWQLYLDGALAAPPPAAPVIVIGGGNVDPNRGEGRRSAVAALLDHPRLQDARPLGDTDPPEATVDWTGITDPPRLRVDYVLPDRALTIGDSGVLWPEPAGQDRLLRHGLVWVDLTLP